MFNFLDLDQERENDELQRRFAFHVKPSLHDMDSVKALFRYMDGNSKLSFFTPNPIYNTPVYMILIEYCVSVYE